MTAIIISATSVPLSVILLYSLPILRPLGWEQWDSGRSRAQACLYCDTAYLSLLRVVKFSLHVRQWIIRPFFFCPSYLRTVLYWKLRLHVFRQDVCTHLFTYIRISIHELGGQLVLVFVLCIPLPGEVSELPWWRRKEGVDHDSSGSSISFPYSV